MTLSQVPQRDSAPDTKSNGKLDGKQNAEARAKAIEAFLNEFAPGENQDLAAEMLVTVCRLARDGCGRGEMKVLNRALKELRYAFKTFTPYEEFPKCTIFGSSRTREDHPQYQQCVKFARLIQEQGWMVITGAGDGIMRAGHHGATREKSFGVAISLPFEQSTNTIIEGDPKLVKFKYFFTRKLMFVKEAEAIVLCPGGFGTQDEGFESLTLVQTGKSSPMPIVLLDEPRGTYWQHWRTYVQSELLRTGMISPDDMNLFFLTDSAEDAVKEIVRFYRRYHSSRFVQDNFVIRMKSPLPDGMVHQLNEEFEDLLQGGDIAQTMKALPEEGDEFVDLPRLVFAYDKKSAGRLRHLINTINDYEAK
ncbi:MAG TPA: LOG family protein [Phycisphaerae bacterium]|nr:LOG family protein [Phycisphaerales bacterium]HRX86488.1 LOG family protein [Phycisphaerae bacterium]